MTLYISDLDGTLLNDDGVISEYTRDNLNKMIENGVQFTVASARSIKSIQYLLSEINLKLPVIEFNGAFITDFYNSYHYMIFDIEKTVLSTIYNMFVNKGYYPLISAFDGDIDRLYYDRIDNEGVKWYIDDLKKKR